MLDHGACVQHHAAVYLFLFVARPLAAESSLTAGIPGWGVPTVYMPRRAVTAGMFPGVTARRIFYAVLRSESVRVQVAVPLIHFVFHVGKFTCHLFYLLRLE